MKERGILMTTENYGKCEAGTKTQTRRIKFAPKPWDIIIEACPYGTVGDRLYVKEGLRRDADGIMYRRDGRPIVNSVMGGRHGWRWKKDTLSPLFMPKFAARLWLELTGVRSEFLGSITEEDAQAEGVKSVSEFIELWKSINKTWEPELCVWVLSFRKVEALA